MRMLSVLQRPIRHICFYLLHMSDPNTTDLSNSARLSTIFKLKKIETIIPGKKALTTLRKTSVNKNSRTSNQDPNENSRSRQSKRDLLEGVWQDLCTRSSWRLPLQTFIQAPSSTFYIFTQRSFRRLQRDVRNISSQTPLQERTSLGYPQDLLARTRLESSWVYKIRNLRISTGSPQDPLPNCRPWTADGPDGPDGLNGLNGPNGPNGPDGPRLTGPTGPTGSTGPTGPTQEKTMAHIW